jgi:DNA repair photolyase
LTISPVICEVRCCQALNKTGISSFKYCLNPYTGCQHACLYCYATFMKKYSGHTEEWGQFVDVKTNFNQVLAKDVWKHQPGPVVVGSVCDPYQPIEAQYRLTRVALEILAERRFPFQILTKSSLVTRDMDILRRYPGSSVSMTITTFNEDVRGLLEPHASPASKRVAAVWELTHAGVMTSVFFGPLLPYFSDTTERLREFFQVLRKVGVKHVLVDKLNYLNAKMPVLQPVLKKHFPEALPAFEAALRNPAAYALNLRQTVCAVALDFDLEVELVF